uniref:platelet-derived growth factor C isoform X2 n=1 Tax=Doryrhamphus excisus TaxID=161450 RepID=UPI0025AEA8BF|nr:platelet-derived growth factor C isoform X2 [Doryrhamphus excisus]
MSSRRIDGEDYVDSTARPCAPDVPEAAAAAATPVPLLIPKPPSPTLHVLPLPPLIQMILPSLLILLASLLQQSVPEAQSSHVSKFHLPSVKEQNGVQESQQEKVISVSEDGGTIYSPDFPHKYPRNIELVWRLVAASNMRILLSFDLRFGLEDPEDGLCKYDFVELEDPSDKTLVGRWCGSQAPPVAHLSKGNQVRVRFVSDEYFPSEPGFLIRYSLQPAVSPEAESVAVLPPSQQDIQELSASVSGLRTLEDVMKYLEPDRWQLDMEDLYKPTWHVLGKSFLHTKKARGVDLNLLREEAQLYSCTPRNFSVSLREELRRTDVIFWPSCLLVRRCGGNCACCSHRCYDCQCVPARLTKKYHEVLLLKHRSGGRGLQKSMTDVALEHHEECSCVCKDNEHPAHAGHV